ncbi:heme exporter protein CcmD [Poseidonocella sp. HB161398]|uniref:heme exporter protein CcmD n=1 Tax=Poseidonocella sp. HB161398 TaxID=2320855 RepID=UPI00110965F9
MPELGKYAGTVLSAYAVSLALLVVLVLASIVAARRTARQLEDAEERRKHG